jgi:hypothetical protein
MSVLTEMLKSHPFWGLLTLAVLAWYSTITIYVAIRGAIDIRHMLRRLGERSRDGSRDEDGGQH